MIAKFEQIDALTLRGHEIVTRQVRLSDGRALAFSAYGAPIGPALFYFHGSGSCRYEALTGHETAKALGVRVIAFDRPGFGRSDPKPGRTIADITADVLRLADGLEIDRFAVSGLSGGAPHALALALARPDRVIAGASLNTAAERPGAIWSSLPVGLRLKVAPMINPFVARRVIYPPFVKDPVAAVTRAKAITARERAELLADGGEMIAALYHEGNRQGLDALIDEIKLFYHRPWGLEWGALSVPYTIFHGVDDLMLPFVRRVAALHPGKVNLVEIEGGHLSGGTIETWTRLANLARETPARTPA